LVLGITASAGANGHKVAVRATDVAVDATFEDRSGIKHDWSRVKVGVLDNYRTTLDTRAGEATSKVPLAKISKVVLLDQTPNGDGYVKATISFTDGSEETSEVKVQDQGKPVQLVGYAKGASSDIDLVKCKYIQFLAKTGEPGETASPRPTTKKKE
jgi:hypothetical protein